MKNILLIFFLVISWQVTKSQKGKLELSSFYRWDKYPAFTIPANSVMTERIKMSGSSFGFNLAYNFFTVKNYSFQIGVGFENLRFSNIKRNNSLFGEMEKRIINYSPEGPLAPAIMYTTDIYAYNNISAQLSIVRLFSIRKTHFTSGVDLIKRYTFRQNYNITNASINDVNFVQNNFRDFGYGIQANFSVQKQIGQNILAPKIIFPIYGSWRQDENFDYEFNDKSRDKWLSGIGVGMSFIF